MNKILIIILALTVVLFCGIMIWYNYPKNTSITEQRLTEDNIKSSDEKLAIEVNGGNNNGMELQAIIWEEYKEDDFGINFVYPAFWDNIKKYPIDKDGKWMSDYKTLSIGYKLNQTGITVSITPNINSSIDELLVCKDIAPDILVAKCEKIIINGVEFKKADFKGNVKDHSNIMTVQNNKLYSIQLIPGDISEADTQHIINSIVIKY